ncbi:MAG: porin [Curvibacter sp.]
MKKTLIAVAALAATGAFAQGLTISGVLDAGYASVSGPNSAVDTKGVIQNGTATSAFILSGSQDLGGGLRANARYEINPDFVGGAGLTGSASAGIGGTNTAANGYHFIGLSGAFGAVEFGRINTLTLAANGVVQPFSTALGSGYGSYGTANSVLHLLPGKADFSGAQTIPTRANNSFKYATPNFSGFTAQVIATVKDGGDSASTGNNRQGVTELGATYVNGPLTVNAANLVVKQGNGPVTGTSPLSLANNGKATMNTLVAAYTVMPGLRLGLGYHTSKVDNSGTIAVDTQTTRIGGTYTVGKIDFLGHYARLNDKLTANADRRVIGLGVDYNLSRTVALTARYQALDLDTNTAADDNTTTLYGGLRVRF